MRPTPRLPRFSHRLGTALATAVSVVVLAVTLAAQQTREAPRLASPNAEQAERLKSGEAVVNTRRNDNVNRGQVIGFIQAPTDKVWGVIFDYDHMKEWYPDMIKSHVVSRADGQGVLEGEVDLPWPFDDRHYQLDARYSETTIDNVPVRLAQFTYRKGSGNLEEMYGYWMVYELPGSPGTSVVKYVINADLGVWMPDFVLRWAQGRMLPGIVSGIRARAK